MPLLYLVFAGGHEPFHGLDEASEGGVVNMTPSVLVEFIHGGRRGSTVSWQAMSSVGCVGPGVGQLNAPIEILQQENNTKLRYRPCSRKLYTNWMQVVHIISSYFIQKTPDKCADFSVHLKMTKNLDFTLTE